MALRDRILKVTFNMPNGDVIIDESVNLKVKIEKAALSIQNRAVIEIVNMTSSFRQQLLSQFTAWNRNQQAAFGVAQPYINMEVEAGYYDVHGAANSSIVYKGQIALCEPAAPPPDLTVRVTCFTHQIDRRAWITERSPTDSSFFHQVLWAGQWMGFDPDHIICNTSYDDQIIPNFAASVNHVAALLPYLQDMYHPAVAAYIDDDFLIVKDRNKILNTDDIIVVSEFIGTPMWTEWGVEFTCFLDPSMRVAQGVQLQSVMNPTLNHGTFVILQMDYDLTSRDTSFYTKVTASPSA
jgi:hypothetical protein